MRSQLLHLLSFCLCLASEARRGRRAVDAGAPVDLEDWPSRKPTKKEAADSGVKLEQAASLPWLPTHTTMCGDHVCKPGEGNLKGYKMWGQPYIHREAWVQSKSRRMPHSPDPPHEHYGTLVRTARSLQENGLIVMAAADFDFREITYNWHQHLTRLGISNALVLAMDRELAAELTRRRIPNVENAANTDAWNKTCLQRHIQRVRTERQLAVCALLLAGLDVLHTDVTVVMLRNVLPMLRSSPPYASADFLVQREGGPGGAYKKIGSCVNPGFMYARGAHTEEARARLLRFFNDIVRRGLVEVRVPHGVPLAFAPPACQAFSHDAAVVCASSAYPLTV